MEKKKRYIESLYFGKKDTVLKRLNNLLIENEYDRSLFYKAAIQASLTEKESFCIAKIYISDEDRMLEPVYVPISISEYDQVIYEWLQNNTGSKRGTALKQLIMNCIEIVEDQESECLPNYHVLISKGITVYPKRVNGLNGAQVKRERHNNKQDKALTEESRNTKPGYDIDANQANAINAFLKNHTHRK